MSKKGGTKNKPSVTQSTKQLSHTLWSPYDTIRDVSDKLGISIQLNDEVAKNLAMDIEYRINEIIEQALKFMRHSKRNILTTQDIERSMKILNLEPLYGYDTSKPLIFKEAMIGPGQTLYYIEDDEVDFESLINQPLPKVPRFTTCSAHWLAIEGVQPAIPQNPNLNDIKLLPINERGTLDNMLSLNNEEISLITNPKTGITTIENKQQIDKKELEIKPLVKHVLSKEMQLYFNKIIEVLLKDDEENEVDIEKNESLKTAVFESIKSDTGLHQLIPYLIQFIAETITHNLKNLKLLTTMLILIYSILSNNSIFLDPYIHSLMPCILTLLLSKNIGPINLNDKGHLQVRKLSSSLLKKIIDEFSSSYNTLKPRITRTLLRAFLSNTTRNSFGTQFGSILGIKSLGCEVIRIILIGNLRNWSNIVLENFNEDDENRGILLDELIECLNELTKDGELLVKEGEILNDEMKDKLSERVGKLIADRICSENNAILIYHGIFFGE